MASIKRTIFSIAIMYLILPPDALPSSSDGFPWASTSNVGTGAAEVEPGVKRDAYGALRDSNMLPDTVSQPVSANQASSSAAATATNTYAPLFTPGNTNRDYRDQRGATMQEGVIAPGGTVSASGVAQGNVGPTQSGPGAAGLFTPNSPGNAAAYNAQVQGGLTASPIVDGNGANVRVSVPMANPSRVPVYQEYSSGVASGALAVGTTGSAIRAAGINTNSSRINNLGVSSTLVPMGSPRPSAWNTLNRRRSNPVYRNTTVKTLPSFVATGFKKQAVTQPSRSIGEVTGAITYADGQKVVLGSKGAAVINPKH